VFGLVGGAKLRVSHALLINSLIIVPAERCSLTVHGLGWPASITAAAIERAESEGLGIVVMHSHGASSTRLSMTDVKSGTQLCEAFRTALPKRPHGTVVLSETGSIGGLAWLPGRELPLQVTGVRWMSNPLVRLPALKVGDASNLMYSRQKILIGEEGQRLLGGATVGIVGLGGGGSHVVQQLTLLGLGRLILVDHDTIDETNRHRLVGARPEDVDLRLKKTEILRRLMKESNPTVEVTVCTERFPSPASIDVLKECDVVVGCVDTLTTRKELQTFAWRYLIPYIDIGLTIQLSGAPPGGAGRAKSISGQVYDLIPGAACLWCAQYLTQSRLEEEWGGKGPTYIMETQEQSQVVSFNGSLASQAVTDVLYMLTGYAVRKNVSNALQFDGISGAISPVILERKIGCHECLELGRGDSIW